MRSARAKVRLSPREAIHGRCGHSARNLIKDGHVATVSTMAQRSGSRKGRRTIPTAVMRPKRRVTERTTATGRGLCCICPLYYKPVSAKVVSVRNSARKETQIIHPIMGIGAVVFGQQVGKTRSFLFCETQTESKLEVSRLVHRISGLATISMAPRVNSAIM